MCPWKKIIADPKRLNGREKEEDNNKYKNESEYPLHQHMFNVTHSHTFGYNHSYGLLSVSGLTSSIIYSEPFIISALKSWNPSPPADG